MNKSIAVFTVLLLIFGYFSYDVKTKVDSDTNLAFSEGDRIENFTLPDIKNETVVLDSVIARNKLVWVNFWATWCGPCRREMPVMSDLYDEYSEEGFSIVAVNIGEDSSIVQNYLSNHPVPFQVVLDPEKNVASKYNIEALPTSFLVDSTGNVVTTGVGIQHNWEFLISSELEGDS